MGDDSGNDDPPQTVCPVCDRRFRPVGRGLYCSSTCRQRSFRLRHRQPDRVTLSDLADRLRRERRLIAQTVYECPGCQERFLGERRCGDCNLMCRKLDLGGRCSSCDDILTVTELLDIELHGGDAVA
jgi:hypothetical protein